MDKDELKFFSSPTADGFKGRLQKDFFGANLGEPAPKGKGPKGLRVTTSKGVVTEIAYEQWEIPGDAFVALSEEFTTRLGPPWKEQASPRTAIWKGDGVKVTLVSRMLDPGLKTTVNVVAGPKTKAKAQAKTKAPAKTKESVDRIAQQFAMTFEELANTTVKTRGDVLVLSGDLKRSPDDCIVVEWPVGTALDSDALTSSLVDRILEEISSASGEDR